MWKAIKEFFGHYDTNTLQKGSGGSTTVTTTVKATANKATPKKRGPAKKPKKSVAK